MLFVQATHTTLFQVQFDTATLESNLIVSSKADKSTIFSVIALLGTHPGETLIHVYRETCAKTAALFIMGKKGNNLQMHQEERGYMSRITTLHMKEEIDRAGLHLRPGCRH